MSDTNEIRYNLVRMILANYEGQARIVKTIGAEMMEIISLEEYLRAAAITEAEVQHGLALDRGEQ